MDVSVILTHMDVYLSFTQTFKYCFQLYIEIQVIINSQWMSRLSFIYTFKYNNQLNRDIQVIINHIVSIKFSHSSIFFGHLVKTNFKLTSKYPFLFISPRMSVQSSINLEYPGSPQFTLIIQAVLNPISRQSSTYLEYQGSPQLTLNIQACIYSP